MTAVRGLLVGFAGLVVLAAPRAGAQYQVNTQVDNRVGGELYGNDGPSQYPVGQFRLLPSEERYARWRSGALPSEIALNRSAVGPLSPHGELDYIPQRSPLQRAMGLPAPRLFNPAYDRQFGAAQQAGYRLPARTGFPQNAQQGLEATTFRRGAAPDPAARQPSSAAPPTPLTGAPDRPLPKGKVFDDVRYDPNATPGAALLSKSPANSRGEKTESLADPKK
jgi:hypothetical protein